MSRRTCCEFICMKGPDCPTYGAGAFAPGAVAGPYRSRMRKRVATWTLRFAAYLAFMALMGLVTGLLS